MALMTDLYPISREDKVACLRREIDMRREVYPRRIAKGAMTMEKASREINVMRAILEDYVRDEK
jgi:hypothetical protein